MKKIIYMIFVLFATLYFISCEKVIDIDLKDSEKNIVIEANITNLPGPYLVKISRTSGYNATNTFQSISGALVTISDDAGNSDTLTESSSGIYRSKTLQGIAGRAYTLIVSIDGKEYTAKSTMPEPVTIDTLQKAIVKKHSKMLTGIKVSFHDPGLSDNYYKFSVIRNNRPINSIFILEDHLLNGSYIEYDLADDDENILSPGDTITVSLCSIDKNIYKYFLTLKQNTADFSQTTPSNPISNISNNALGYFNAHSLSSKVIIIN